MEDLLFWDEDEPNPLSLTTLHGYGHYYEQYRKVEGSWQIQSFRLSRLLSDGMPPPITRTSSDAAL